MQRDWAPMFAINFVIMLIFAGVLITLSASFLLKRAMHGRSVCGLNLVLGELQSSLISSITTDTVAGLGGLEITYAIKTLVQEIHTFHWWVLLHLSIGVEQIELSP